ncbi:MAG: BamA/TamA family outer membrane protein [Ignavibacteria bacterium]|nr:BamA/TamA family outer membrane protein [Ignavibacteria bacterium]MBT8382053.1 BamA/TamA family outer membrane protein [Ignavibacteria bacterium]MBT8392468.1 BamA/TamA family outer membrane protein [Ignavibacteria bacterium]NNJ52050.1 BamA/TamA family outer membrane protein [Ignavibacteriaceae bacterium]NNL19901.1 BamA/TamA family outer membrane protein [Ignavibacteriaceae bacterium]
MKSVTFYIVVFLVLYSILTITNFSQQKDSIESNEFDWYAVPIVFYTPETDLSLGALAMILFRLTDQLNSRPSSTRFVGYYTLNSQYSFAIKPEIYFNDDKNLLQSDFSYSKIIDKYYGLGNDTEEIDNPDYEARSFLLGAKFQSQIFPNFRAGLIYEFSYAKIIDAKENPYLNSGSVTASDGGINSGLGLAVSYDSRDKLFYPESGGYYEFSSVFFNSVIGSDFSYTKTLFDFRRFHKVGSNQVVAFQFFYNFIIGSAPFYDVPPLGGEDIMRGYFRGRYRDNHYFAAQLEYRLRFWWKFGAVGFIGVGDVASRLTKFELKKFKYSYGAGLRFRIDDAELIDLRADLGFGKGTFEVYFSYNQSF